MYNSDMFIDNIQLENVLVVNPAFILYQNRFCVLIGLLISSQILTSSFLGPSVRLGTFVFYFPPAIFFKFLTILYSKIR